MQRLLLPLFPLNTVLFPGAPLPLHIFEDRYKEMFKEILQDRIEFGVVLATEKGIANTGCTANVERVVEEYADGRLDLVTIGRRRFEINLLNEERPFLRGDVHFFDDEAEESAPLEVRESLILQAASLEDAPPAISVEDPRLSFLLAQHLPDLEDRQAVLAMRSEAQRIRHLAQVLPARIEQKRTVDRVRTVAIRNGHGRHLDPGKK